MWAYFDTSALVKRYIDEAGGREVRHLLRRYDCVTSAILLVELRSALRRRVIEDKLSAAHVTSIRSRVASDQTYWALVEVGADVLAAAEILVATYPIRTLDAIHVASAQLFGARKSTPELIFVSADRRQTEAAAAVGLTVKPMPSPS